VVDRTRGGGCLTALLSDAKTPVIQARHIGCNMH